MKNILNLSQTRRVTLVNGYCSMAECDDVFRVRIVRVYTQYLFFSIVEFPDGNAC